MGWSSCGAESSGGRGRRGVPGGYGAWAYGQVLQEGEAQVGGDVPQGAPAGSAPVWKEEAVGVHRNLLELLHRRKRGRQRRALGARRPARAKVGPGEVPKATCPPNRSQVATDRLTREPSVTPATSTPWRVRTAGSMGGARPAAGLLCTTRLAKSTSQYYSALQSLHKPLPSHTLYYTKSAPITTLYYTACKKYFPVLLCTTKLAQSTS